MGVLQQESPRTLDRAFVDVDVRRARLLDEFKKALGFASPLAITAAMAGLAVGLAGAKIGQAMRANGTRR